MAIADRNGLPVAIWTTGASTHEVKLVENTVDARFIKKNSEVLIGGKA
ncbi:MAG: hypothetical protein QM534_04045 [Sediminibacterium sp.]|nr:hypothetical protein [Sediminibacterium sp.]